MQHQGTWTQRHPLTTQNLSIDMEQAIAQCKASYACPVSTVSNVVAVIPPRARAKKESDRGSEKNGEGEIKNEGEHRLMTYAEQLLEVCADTRTQMNGEKDGRGTKNKCT